MGREVRKVRFKTESVTGEKKEEGPKTATVSYPRVEAYPKRRAERERRDFLRDRGKENRRHWGNQIATPFPLRREEKEAR